MSEHSGNREMDLRTPQTKLKEKHQHIELCEKVTLSRVKITLEKKNANDRLRKCA